MTSETRQPRIGRVQEQAAAELSVASTTWARVALDEISPRLEVEKAWGALAFAARKYADCYHDAPAPK